MRRDRTCTVCGGLVGYANASGVCQGCREKAALAKATRVCLGCGATFKALSTKQYQKYCNMACFKAARVEQARSRRGVPTRPEAKACVFCGAALEQGPSNKRYCSDACFRRQRYHGSREAYLAFRENVGRPGPTPKKGSKKRGKTASAADARWVYKVGQGRCFWCKAKLKGGLEGRAKGLWHVDHAQPLAKGGSRDRTNLVAACATCNMDKGASAPHEWGPFGQPMLPGIIGEAT